MSEKPILFSGAMVRAILDGRKTMTRRVVKPQPSGTTQLRDKLATMGSVFCWPDGKKPLEIRCPYSPGDRLWVRETWIPCQHGSYEPWTRDAKAPHRWSDAFIQYRADFGSDLDYNGFWRPSIFMPRWASRITLEVTDVKCERLQSITKADAIAEGATLCCDTCGNHPSAEAHWVCEQDYEPVISHRVGFQRLWDSINEWPHPWERNDWVWAISFKVVKP